MYELNVNGKVIMKDSFEKVSKKIEWLSSLMKENENYVIFDILIKKI